MWKLFQGGGSDKLSQQHDMAFIKKTATQYESALPLSTGLLDLTDDVQSWWSCFRH